MQYDFYVETTQGIKNAIVTSDNNFECAPFGHVPYRSTSSCECEEIVIEDFWNCVDLVLVEHSISHTEFIRCIRAYSDGVLYGEDEPHIPPTISVMPQLKGPAGDRL